MPAAISQRCAKAVFSRVLAVHDGVHAADAVCIMVHFDRLHIDWIYRYGSAL